MIKTVVRSGCLAIAVALALALAPAPSAAIAPALLLMVKQLAQQAATSMVKDTLLSGLRGMGCKGMALSNALAAVNLRGGAGGSPGGVANMPVGAAGMLGGIPQSESIPADMAAKMAAMMPNAGQLPAGMALDPEAMAMMARMQQAMAAPPSPGETLATIDELFELGFMPKAIQTEFKECMVLVPAAIPALGMGMGMLKPMIPLLRQVRAELHALPPAQQDEVAAALAQELKALPTDQHAALMEHIDSGFFPPSVSAGVKRALTAK